MTSIRLRLDLYYIGCVTVAGRGGRLTFLDPVARFLHQNIRHAEQLRVMVLYLCRSDTFRDLGNQSVLGAACPISQPPELSGSWNARASVATTAVGIIYIPATRPDPPWLTWNFDVSPISFWMKGFFCVY